MPPHNHNPVENSKFEKSEAFLMCGMLDYIDHSVVVKTIIKKETGNVSVFAFDSGEALIGKVSPFGILIMIMDGNAEIIIDDRTNMLETGESILIPAHCRNTIKANVRFKMLSTMIKSGYEE
jgi:quercetin dioxygenase-like cupin family protein